MTCPKCKNKGVIPDDGGTSDYLFCTCKFGAQAEKQFGPAQKEPAS